MTTPRPSCKELHKLAIPVCGFSARAPPGSHKLQGEPDHGDLSVSTRLKLTQEDLGNPVPPTEQEAGPPNHSTPLFPNFGPLDLPGYDRPWALQFHNLEEPAKADPGQISLELWPSQLPSTLYPLGRQTAPEAAKGPRQVSGLLPPRASDSGAPAFRAQGPAGIRAKALSHLPPVRAGLRREAASAA